MKKKILFFIGIVLLCLAGYGFYLYNKPHEGVGNAKPDVRISADSLYARYAANEQSANVKCLNKVIVVTGRVDEIETTKSSLLILLKTSGEVGGVSCNFYTGTNHSFPFKTGDVIRIRGRCTGFLLDVALTDCEIEK